MNVAEHVRIVYDADAPWGWAIVPPALPQSLDGWRIARHTLQRRDDLELARTRLHMVLVLEPFLPGEKEVPSWRFTCTPPAPPHDATAQPASIATQPIKVRVDRLISDGAPVQLSLQGPLAMELPSRRTPPWAWGLAGTGVLGVLCAAAWAVYAIRKRPPVSIDPVRTAREELRAMSTGPGTGDATDQFHMRELAARVGRNLRTLLSASVLDGSEHKSAREIVAALQPPRVTIETCDHARTLLNDIDQATFDPSTTLDIRSVSLLASRSLSLDESLTGNTGRGGTQAACVSLITLSFLDLSGGIEWHTPLALVLLLIPVGAAAWMLRTPRRAALPLPLSPHFIAPLRTFRGRVTWVPGVLTIIGSMALIIAIARPRIGFSRTERSSEAIAIQIVIDRSGSMGAEMDLDGVQLSRLDVVKRVLRDFLLGDSKTLPGRHGDLVGLVSFARFADTNCPLVRDMHAVVQLADALEPAREQFEGGTAIGDGLALAAARLKTAEQELVSRSGSDQDTDLKLKSKAIMLLTDGDNNVGVTLPEEAAALCSEWGVKLYIIGIGGGGTTLMHTPFGDRRVPVTSEVNERNLRPLAEQTGGTFRLATDADSLRRIYSEFDRLEKSTVRTSEYTDYTELFMYPAGVGLCALGVGSLLGATWLRRVPT